MGTEELHSRVLTGRSNTGCFDNCVWAEAAAQKPLFASSQEETVFYHHLGIARDFGRAGAGPLASPMSLRPLKGATLTHHIRLTSDDTPCIEQLDLVRTVAIFSVLYTDLSLQLWSPVGKILPTSGSRQNSLTSLLKRPKRSN